MNTSAYEYSVMNKSINKVLADEVAFFTRYSLVFTRYSLFFYSLLVAFLLVTRCVFTRYSLSFSRYSLP